MKIKIDNNNDKQSKRLTYIKELYISNNLSIKDMFILYTAVKNNIEIRSTDKKKCSSGCLFQSTSELYCTLFERTTIKYNRCKKCLKIFSKGE